MAANIGESRREHWRAYISHRAMFNAGLFGIVKFGIDALGQLPPHVIAVAQAKVHELIDEAMRMERAGKSEQDIHSDIETQLVRLLREFKPVPRETSASNSTQG